MKNNNNTNLTNQSNSNISISYQMKVELIDQNKNESVYKLSGSCIDTCYAHFEGETLVLIDAPARSVNIAVCVFESFHSMKMRESNLKQKLSLAA